MRRSIMKPESRGVSDEIRRSIMNSPTLGFYDPLVDTRPGSITPTQDDPFPNSPRGASTSSETSQHNLPDNPPGISPSAILRAARAELAAPVRLSFEYAPHQDAETRPADDFTGPATIMRIPSLHSLPSSVKQTYTLSTVVNLVNTSSVICGILNRLHLTHIIGLTAQLHDSGRILWRRYTSILPPEEPSSSNTGPDAFEWLVLSDDEEIKDELWWKVDDHGGLGAQEEREVEDERVWWDWAKEGICPSVRDRDLGRPAEVIVRMGGPWYGDSNGARLKPASKRKKGEDDDDADDSEDERIAAGIGIAL